jgi:hypothetical protein
MDTYTLANLAEIARNHIFRTEPDPYDAKAAWVFAVDRAGNVRTIAATGDIYASLAQAAFIGIKPEEVAFGASTCGWASPIETGADGETCPPSEHPLRRRCQMVTLIDMVGDMHSVVTFQDEPDNPMTEQGESTGSLAMAMRMTLQIMMEEMSRKVKPDDY